ncbi:MAG: hypothetical protein E6G19_00470 [Actinobacteria bacterium]|nr:MAG: hypothetical protein E6G19_00470 [Actinomycetota bacterium]
MEAGAAVQQFLNSVPTEQAVELRPALEPALASHEFLVVAKDGDDRPTILAFDPDRLTYYQRSVEGDEDIISVVVLGPITGMTLTERRKRVDGGLLTTSYALAHPALPLGEVRIDAYILGDDFEEEYQNLRNHLEPFLGRGCCA